MIVFFDKASIVTLPYLDNKNKQCRHTFIPGENNLPLDVWNAIVKYNKIRFENYYDSVLRPFKPVYAATNGKIDLHKLTEKDFSALVDNTLDEEKLKKYGHFNTSIDSDNKVDYLSVSTDTFIKFLSEL